MRERPVAEARDVEACRARGRQARSEARRRSDEAGVAAGAAAPRSALELPADCGDPIATLRSSGERPSYDVVWVHLVGPDADVVVQGDKILVRVNATTGKVHSVFKKWRSVPPTPPA